MIKTRNFDENDPIWLVAQTKMIDHGIIPYYKQEDVERALGQMTQKERKLAKRKFRKICRKHFLNSIKSLRKHYGEHAMREIKRRLVCQLFYNSVKDTKVKI